MSGRKPPPHDEDLIASTQESSDAPSLGDASPGVEATRIDLGDDLLEKTAVLLVPGSTAANSVSPTPIPSPSAPPVSAPQGQSPTVRPLSPHASTAIVEGEKTYPLPTDSEQIADQLQSARILLGEGILEEAKRILRRVLIADQGNLDAKRMLDEIQGIELKQIFGDSEGPRRRLGRREPETDIEISAELVLRDLDRDLRLGMEGLDSSSLFSDREALEAFGEKMDRDLAGAAPADRIDLGIAFLEMGLPSLAVRHFQAVVQRLKLEPDETLDSLVSATGLLAWALISAGRAFEAAIAMQSLLGDAELSSNQKIDLMYLMGRAQEMLGKWSEAMLWYRKTLEVDADYRDVAARLRRSNP